MKKIIIVAVLTLLCFTFVPWSTCAAADELYGCAIKKNGLLRIVNDHSECLHSEVPVTLTGYATEPKPNVVTVNCPGESVQDALDNAPATGRFIVKIAGICNECVNISRNYVTLRGSDPEEDGLNCPSAGTLATILIYGAQKVQLENLNLTGAQRGINAWHSATFEASNLIVHDTGGGIGLDTNSTATLKECTVRDCDFGIGAGRGSSLVVWGGVVEDIGVFAVSAGASGNIILQPPPWTGPSTVVRRGDFHGLIASDGGSIECLDCTVEDFAGTGVFAINGGSVTVHGNLTRIQRNQSGGVGANGGFVWIQQQGVQVLNNNGAGVFGWSGGVVGISGAIIEGNDVGVSLNLGSSGAVSDGTIIRNSIGDGIQLTDTSTLVFPEGANEINNNGGWGIYCDDAFHDDEQINGTAYSFSGNTSGDISCLPPPPP